MKKSIIAFLTAAIVLFGIGMTTAMAAVDTLEVYDLSYYKADSNGYYTMIYNLEAGKIKVSIDLKNTTGSDVNATLKVDVLNNGASIASANSDTKVIRAGKTDYLAADIDVADDSATLSVSVVDKANAALIETRTFKKHDVVIVPDPGNAIRPLSKKVAISANGVDIPVKYEHMLGLEGGKRDSKERFFNVAMFTMSEGVPITIEIKGLDAPIKDPLQVSPKALNIPRYISKNAGHIVIDKPQMLVIRDWTSAKGTEGYEDIFILVTPLEKDVPYKHASDITYYSPETNPANSPSFADGQKVYFDKGYHPNSGVLALKSNMKVYFAPGATLNSAVQMFDAENIKLYGRGLLEARETSKSTGKGIYAKYSKNLIVEGIGLRNNHEWQTLYLACSDVVIDNTNIMGVVLNNDGIDIDGVQNFLITNNFILCGDDAFGWHALKYEDIKTSQYPLGQPTDNITAINTVIYNVRGGNPVRIGSSMEQESISNITIIDTYTVVTETGNGFFIDIEDWAALSNMHVENYYVEQMWGGGNAPIRIETWASNYSRINEGKAMPQGLRSPIGSVNNVTIKNFWAPSKGLQPPIRIGGYAEDYSVRNITFENVIIQTGTNTYTGGEGTQPIDINSIFFAPTSNKADPDGIYVSEEDVTIK